MSDWEEMAMERASKIRYPVWDLGHGFVRIADEHLEIENVLSIEAAYYNEQAGVAIEVIKGKPLFINAPDIYVAACFAWCIRKVIYG